jgi:hypothetical protein
VRRRQLVELEDLPWFPQSVRDGGTDWLAFMFNSARPFAPVAPKIRAAMDATGTTNVLDLCSGGGGPWMTLVHELGRSGPVNVELSDLFPNVRAFKAQQERSGGRLDYREEPVDVTDVPAALDGVRTLFNAFHHFPPETAASILEDAVRKRRAIAIFEGINHRGAGLLFMPVQLPAILLLTPFVRPFRWSRLLLTLRGAADSVSRAVRRDDVDAAAVSRRRAARAGRPCAWRGFVRLGYRDHGHDAWRPGPPSSRRRPEEAGGRWAVR